ncbi:MAG: DUF547 domain-containing protein [Acidimicrobiia bacterium]
MTESPPTSPNVLSAGWSILTSLIRVRAPRPRGDATVDHSRLGKILESLQGDVIGRLPAAGGELAVYLDEMESVDPDTLTVGESLAFWINVYNAAALRLGAVAARDGVPTVFGIPGAFTSPAVTVTGEALSLDQIEHAKVRRFGDPRIHAGLVCGAMSCPTLRREPYTGDVDSQLDDQMRRFLTDGALVTVEADNRVTLSSIFAWFGRDFVKPHRMPTLLPARRRTVLAALTPWMDNDVASWIEGAEPTISFSSYDWRLGCAIA